MERRTYLRALGGVGVLGTAGCVESIGDSPPADGTPTDGDATATPGDSTDGTASRRTLSIYDPPSDEPAEYEFTVSGDLEQSRHYGASVDDHDDVEGSTATGRVWGMMDSYRFTGEIVDFRVSRDVKVVVDGQEVDADDLSPATSDG